MPTIPTDQNLAPIAARLSLAPATVKAYVSRVLEKFGVESRVGS